MKRSHFISLGSAVILMLVLAILLRHGENGTSDPTRQGAPNGRQESRSRPHSEVTTASETKRLRPSRPAGEDPKLEKLRRELEEANAKLERLSKPLHEDVASATIRARVNKGERLVTGGYVKPDGTREYTFIEHEVKRSEDGAVAAIIFEVQTMALGNFSIGTGKLSAIETNAQNTLQHGDVWSEDEFQDFRGELDRERERDPGFVSGGSLVSMGVVPGEEGIIGPLLDTNGNAFEIAITASPVENGGVDIEARVQSSAPSLPVDQHQSVEEP
jgi:hypothetical protein